MAGLNACVVTPSRAELRRRKIMDTARSLFIENGFHATGTAQIARESGIAIGQMYRDFSSKEEIVSAIVQEDCEQFMQADALDTAIRAGDAALVLEWLHHVVEPDDDVQGRRLFAEIVAESARNERIATIFTSIQDRFRNNLLAALALLAPGERLANRRALLADVIMTVSIGLLNHQLVNPTLNVSALAKVFQGSFDDQLARLRVEAG